MLILFLAEQIIIILCTERSLDFRFVRTNDKFQYIVRPAGAQYLKNSIYT